MQNSKVLEYVGGDENERNRRMKTAYKMQNRKGELRKTSNLAMDLAKWLQT